MGVDVVMRQTANRPTDFRQGTRLGREDHLIEWHRHRNRWKWMSREIFAALPRVLLMRELRVRVEKRGFRTKELVVVTSLLDAKVYSRNELEGLYRARWACITRHKIDQANAANGCAEVQDAGYGPHGDVGAPIGLQSDPRSDGRGRKAPRNDAAATEPPR